VRVGLKRIEQRFEQPSVLVKVDATELQRRIEPGVGRAEIDIGSACHLVSVKLDECCAQRVAELSRRVDRRDARRRRLEDDAKG
jgi:hypothetical protein